MSTSPTPLRVQGVSKSYRTGQGTVPALLDLNFEIGAGRSTALVGESGCGKTTAAYCIAGLHAIDSGAIFLGGKNFSAAAAGVQRTMRRDFGIVFQNPLSALNPRLRIWQCVAEPLRVHEPSMSHAQRLESARAMLLRVGLAEQHVQAYPSALSGGQLQRAVLARALILQPRLLILDEPTSALDVSVQAQVLNLLQELGEALGLSYLFITHNLALVEILADQVMVMYAGRVVEAGPVTEVFAAPRHPYTRELIQSIPDASAQGRRALREMDLEPTEPAALSGCAFRLRCGHAKADCANTRPTLVPVSHAVACLHPIS